MEQAVLSMKNSNAGFSLIELILAMVVLSIGLTGILSVMMTTINNSVTPELRWQINAIAENILERLLKKNEVLNISKKPFVEAFPELASQFKWSNHLTVAISAKPYIKNNNATLVCVILGHEIIGDTQFCAIKSPGQINE